MSRGRLDRYAFINAKLKTRLSLVLPDEFFIRLSRTATPNEAVQLLKETPFAPLERIYAETGDLKLVELELFSMELHFYREIQKMVDGELLVFVNALLLRPEIENLKEALRLWLDRTVRRRDISSPLGYMYQGTIYHGMDINQIVSSADVEALRDALEGTPYASLVSANAEEIISSRSLFSLETDLDRFYYSRVRESSAGLGPEDRAVVERILGMEIDLENLERIVRFRSFYGFEAARIRRCLISGGYRIDPEAALSSLGTQDSRDLPPEALRGYPELSSFSSSGDASSRLLLLEEYLRQVLFKEVSRLLGGDPFSVGIILAYFSIRRREVRRLSTILNAKYYGLGEETIGRYL
ncbi:V-type ATPase subunit [Marispirochaeta aestuarii]|uniref:V-type ATPase subunit n=1 Tax=Marispirochaeta aestuarii TaxID=1963862 RepID=UPI002ABDD379|nr:V-type ATPase subunit [Marispirochaeta aestuarii]